MRIVNRKEFLSMPEGVVFCKYYSLGTFESIQIKGPSTDIDYMYTDIFDIDSTCSIEWTNKMIEYENGKPFPVVFGDTLSRDGLFEEDQLFAVFSDTEVLNYAKLLIDAVRKEEDL